MKKILKHEYNIVAAVDNMDFCDRIKPSAVLQHFQDIATEHANLLGIGYKETVANNCFWVLTKVAAEIDKQPQMGEKLRIATYPRKPTAVEATRDYYIFNSKNELIIRGSSKWCVLDIANRKIKRISEIFDYTDDYYRPDDAVEGGCRPKKCCASRSRASESSGRSSVTSTKSSDSRRRTRTCSTSRSVPAS